MADKVYVRSNKAGKAYVAASAIKRMKASSEKAQTMRAGENPQGQDSDVSESVKTSLKSPGTHFKQGIAWEMAHKRARVPKPKRIIVKKDLASKAGRSISDTKVKAKVKTSKPQYRIRAEQSRRQAAVAAQKADTNAVGRFALARQGKKVDKLRSRVSDKTFEKSKTTHSFAINRKYGSQVRDRRRVKRLRTRNVLTSGLATSGIGMLSDTGNEDADKIVRATMTTAHLGVSAYRRHRTNVKTGEKLRRQINKAQSSRDDAIKAVVKGDHKLQKKVRQYEKTAQKLSKAQVNGNRVEVTRLQKRLKRQDKQILTVGSKKKRAMDAVRKNDERIESASAMLIKKKAKDIAVKKGTGIALKLLAGAAPVIMFIFFVLIPITAVAAGVAGAVGGRTGIAEIGPEVEYWELFDQVGPDAQDLYIFLVNQMELEDAQVLAIMMEANALSGFDRTREQAAPGTGIGLFMWSYGPSGTGGRRGALEEFCRAHNDADWREIWVQLAFFKEEYISTRGRYIGNGM